MTRKGAWAGVSFWAALALCAAFRGRHDLWLLGAALVCGALGFFLEGVKRKYVVFCACFFAAGVGVNMLYTADTYDRLIALDGETVTVSGYITDVRQATDDLDAVTVRGKAGGVTTEISFLLPYDDYECYRELTVTGKVSEISDSARYQSQSYSYSSGIFLEGSYTEDYTLGHRTVRPLLAAVRRYRDRLYRTIIRISPGEEGSFLGAMLCGDKSELLPSLKTAMYRVGLGHIMTVSGTHLAVTSAFFGALLSLFVQSRRKRYVLVLGEIWGFALFSGLAVPVVRAAVMLTLSSSGFIFGRRSDCANSLGLGAILLTLFQPYCAISPSFVLSFLSVFAVGVIAPRLPVPKDAAAPVRMLFSALNISLSVMLLTAPAGAYFFGTVSVLTVVSNILLVPFCVLALQICSLLIFTGGWVVAAYPAVFMSFLLVKPVIWAVKLGAGLGIASLGIRYVLLWVLVSVSAGVPLYVGIRYKRLRGFYWCCIVVVCFWFLTSNILKLADRSPRIVIIPGGRYAEYIYISSGTADIFDVGAKGRLNAAVQSCLDAYGADRMGAAFFTEKGCAAAAGLEERLLVLPETAYVDTEPSLEDIRGISLELLEPDYELRLESMSVIREEEGFRVLLPGAELVLNGGCFYIGDEGYSIGSENYPLEIDLETMTVRRLTYAYN